MMIARVVFVVNDVLLHSFLFSWLLRHVFTPPWVKLISFYKISEARKSVTMWLVNVIHIYVNAIST